ncbi:MAG: metallophosphoesterase [Ignavibacteria bacterium]
MKDTKILHVTDFHLENADAIDEFLSKGSYQRYINSLVKEIKKDFETIDCIVATGDFVDCGKGENFEHAKLILFSLAAEFNLSPKNIGVCIGNHDIKCTFKRKKIDTSKDDKTQFNLFSTNFSNKLSFLFKTDRANLSSLAENVYLLALDSTFNRKANSPGKFLKTEAKGILQMLKDSSVDNPDNILIIASHYPIRYFDSFYDSEDIDKHFWQSAVYLKMEIQENINQAKILYLFGDTHQSDREIHEQQAFIMTSRWGIKIPRPEDDPKKKSDISQEAKLIHYLKNRSLKIHTFSYHSKIHKLDANDGHWVGESPIKIDLQTKHADLIKGRYEKDLDLKIIQQIKLDGLYRFDRFLVNKEGEEKISLGWISINNLLKEQKNGILSEIIVSTKDYLEEKIRDISVKDVLYVGIDYWGSIISSQLSVMTGSINYCRALRGSEKHYTKSEQFSETDLETLFINIKYVVFITDVVSTGSTLRRIYEKIISNPVLEAKTKEIKFITISVMSDRRQRKKADLGFLYAFGTFCNNLRIPVVDKEDLPDEGILPSKKHFY